MQPFNYRQQVVNPFEQAIGGAMKGFQLGASIRQVQEQREAARLAQEQQEALQGKLRRLQQNPNPTFADYEEIAMFLPEKAAESLRKNFDMRTKEQQDAAKSFAGQVVAALSSPNEEAQKRGIALLRQRAEAEKNAGNTQEAQAYELHAKIAETGGPAGVKAVANEIMIIGTSSFGKEWAEGILKLREAPQTFRPITLAERKSFGLPADVPFGVGPDGKPVQLTKSELVKITGPLVGAENKYAETVGAEAAREDVESVRAAQKGVGDLAKIDRTLNELYTSQAITGLGADIFKNVERVKTLLGSDFAAKKVADTELLDALLGADVFPQIGALGIGARGLDTPAEREFLRQVMTGAISMNRDTLIKMTEIRRNVQQRAIENYNERLERGELDRYFDITKRRKEPLTIAPAPARPAPSGPRQPGGVRPGVPQRASPSGMRTSDDILRELGVIR